MRSGTNSAARMHRAIRGTGATTPAVKYQNYPRYGNYASDSIGEFGYDPLADASSIPRTALITWATHS